MCDVDYTLCKEVTWMTWCDIDYTLCKEVTWMPGV